MCLFIALQNIQNRNNFFPVRQVTGTMLRILISIYLCSWICGSGPSICRWALAGKWHHSKSRTLHLPRSVAWQKCSFQLPEKKSIKMRSLKMNTNCGWLREKRNVMYIKTKWSPKWWIKLSLQIAYTNMSLIISISFFKLLFLSFIFSFSYKCN